jgi:formate-dependent nitrite reductase membrane component NrfD
VDGQRINRASSRVVLVLSVLALLTVLAGLSQPRQAPATDEGALAHIFQLSIVALGPAILLFLLTADWRQPLESVRSLVVPAAALVLAFAALYYLEHYR